jgi:sodium transport system ATP-binding protein
MIRVDHLTKRYKSITAVDGLSFEVGPGRVTGFLGPNGAGKTTTLRMILGLLRPTSGHASIAGFASSTHPEEVKRRVGLVSATTGFYQWLSVREFLLFFSDLYGVGAAAADQSLRRLTDVLGLHELLHRRCVTLSTGQKQRVQLARALMHDPPVLLLDEPTLGMDVFGSQMVLEYLGHLRAEGKAVILTTHRLDEAERLCDRFGLLHRSRLVREGSLAELRASTGRNTLVDMFLQLSSVGPMLRTEKDRC